MSTADSTTAIDPVGSFFDEIQKIHGLAPVAAEETKAEEQSNDDAADERPAGAAEDGDESPDGEGQDGAEQEAPGETAGEEVKFQEAEELLAELGDTPENRKAMDGFVAKVRTKLTKVIQDAQTQAYQAGLDQGREIEQFYGNNPELRGHEAVVAKAAEEVGKKHADKPAKEQYRLVAENAKARLNVVQKVVHAKAPEGGGRVEGAKTSPTTPEAQRQAGAIEMFEQLKDSY